MSDHHKKAEKEESGFIDFFMGLFYLIRFVWKLSIQLLFFPFKGAITRTLDLEQYAAYWSRWSWLYLSIKWCAAWFFLDQVLTVMRAYARPDLFSAPTSQIILSTLAVIVCGLVFNVFEWVGQYAHDPAILKRLAGVAAEQYVQELIDKNMPSFHNAQSLHGQLFVFNAGQPNEFSVEADHVLITQRNIFVIETKCKSGTIFACPDRVTWKVLNPHGESDMRNALKQAKNAARVLQRQMAFPVDVIPLVAIKGNDVTIVDGPSNVVLAEDLIALIQAFEQRSENQSLDPLALYALLRSKISHDPAALQQHIVRAQIAKQKAEQTHIVQNASIQ